VQSPWLLPAEVCGATERRCDVVAEAVCAEFQCQLNDSDLVGPWLPLQKALKPPDVTQEALARQEKAVASYQQCAAHCASQGYLSVDIAGGATRAALAVAAERLTECGVVHLSGGAWGGALASWELAVNSLQQMSATGQDELKRDNLHGNRTELFVPLVEGLPDPLDSSVITAVVAEYLGEPFALDYMSVLNARAGVAGAQSLHADVPFFPRTSLSIHTALNDISAAMGPTLFCPCTHTAAQWETKPDEEAAEAIRFSHALRSAIRATGSAEKRRCLGAAYVPQRLPAGLVTIYDGAVLHAGLANTAQTDRLVFNVNIASPPGYLNGGGERARQEARRSWARSNTRPGEERLAEVREWMESLPHTK